MYDGMIVDKCLHVYVHENTALVTHESQTEFTAATTTIIITPL